MIEGSINVCKLEYVFIAYSNGNKANDLNAIDFFETLKLCNIPIPHMVGGQSGSLRSTSQQGFGIQLQSEEKNLQKKTVTKIYFTSI